MVSIWVAPPPSLARPNCRGVGSCTAQGPVHAQTASHRRDAHNTAAQQQPQHSQQQTKNLAIVIVLVRKKYPMQNSERWWCVHCLLGLANLAAGVMLVMQHKRATGVFNLSEMTRDHNKSQHHYSVPPQPTVGIDAHSIGVFVLDSKAGLC